MNRDEVLALYDSEVRARPSASGTVAERDGDVVRLVGDFNFISSWDLTARTARAAVAGQAAYFRSRGEELIWRVYEHDEPTELSAHLAEQGFEPTDSGTLMFFDLKRDLPVQQDAEVEVRRVRTLKDLDGFVSASDQAFEDDVASRRREAYAKALTDANLALFVACIAGQAVASARLELAPGRSFGQLFGGGVTPAHRKRGLYRALVAARVGEAKRRGLRYLSTEARDTSRPILERLGFTPIARETTWVLRA